MLIFALAALLAVRSDTDSVYATPAVRQAVERSAAANAAPPPELRGYRARVETELSFLVRDTLGREHATQIEQLAANATWERGTRYQLHVVGFRSQSIGVPFSALSFVRGWTIPLLYGNDLRLGIEGARRSGGIVVRRGSRRDTIPVAHPFAADRERRYRFGGGDTVTILHTGDRDVPIVRITVVPRFDSGMRFAGFRGELDVDAERGAVVRMRGQLVYPDASSGGRLGGLVARAAGIVSAAYVEFVMEEVEGRYWLPAFERTEFQASAASFGPERSVFRVMSRFDAYAVDTATTSGTGDDSLPLAVRVSFAPRDSIDAFTGWREELGHETASVTGGDFEDLSPDAWRPTGPPRFTPFPRRLDEVLRYDRVEGAFTGLAGELRFRDAAPGLTARAFGGWAWDERTARGGAMLELARADWTYGIRAERSLASTNDFRPALEGGGSLAALLASIDDADYVDRWIAAASLVRDIGATDRTILTGEIGVGQDRPEIARLRRGPFAATRFLPNRGAIAGRYARLAGDVELHPNVSGEFLESGVGARVHLEYGRGDLNWARGELTISAREYRGDLWLASHASGGVVLGRTIPPQQLFELGGNEGLPGYGYKQFGGDRAAVAGLAAGCTLPLLRSPLRLIRGYVLPGLSPGVAAGVQGGWAEAGTAGAWRALRLLGRSGPAPDAELVSLPTNGIRATADLRLTLFSGAVSAGVARPVDQAGGWRVVVGVGEAY